MKDYILETCVDSVESAMAAAEGGADRLELCSNLIIGGTTPGPWLFEEIRKRSDIRIHALIRPRFGDFCYTDAEFSMIRNAVKDFRKIGSGGCRGRYPETGWHLEYGTDERADGCGGRYVCYAAQGF